uniref:Kelch-like protein 12 n=1 Tax=Phallusia mammillata TaxID=59560 RepID=A0A6F9DFZ4_9ASCI|nr:kelch-like protein 12 [Phallusia mammillata]
MGNVRSYFFNRVGGQDSFNQQKQLDNELLKNLSHEEINFLNHDWFLVVCGATTIEALRWTKSMPRSQISTPNFHVCYMSAIVLHQGKVMFCGGMETDINRSIMSSIISFDGKHWKKEGDMLHKRGAPCAVSVAGLLYIFGGYNYENGYDLGCDKFVHQCETFEDGKCTIYTTENPPRFHHSSSAVVVEDVVYIIGGNPVAPMDTRWASTPNSLCSSTVNCLKTKTNKWSDGPPLNHGRNDFAVAKLRSKIYVFGGTNTREHPGSAEFLDTSIDNPTWTLLPTAPLPLYCASSCIASNEEFIVLGGGKQPYSFNTISLTWSKTIKKPNSEKVEQVESLCKCSGGSKIFGLGM